MAHLAGRLRRRRRRRRLGGGRAPARAHLMISPRMPFGRNNVTSDEQRAEREQPEFGQRAR